LRILFPGTGITIIDLFFNLKLIDRLFKKPYNSSENTRSLFLKEGVMMSAKVTCIGLKGLEGYKVTVEVQAVPGLNSIIIVGLPDTSVKESKQRITAAFHSLPPSTEDYY
jgi:hypothetical protein